MLVHGSSGGPSLATISAVGNRLGCPSNFETEDSHCGWNPQTDLWIRVHTCSAVQRDHDPRVAGYHGGPHERTRPQLKKATDCQTCDPTTENESHQAMPLPLYARGEFERKEDVTTTAVLLLASTKSRWNALAQCLAANGPARESVDFTRYSNGRKLLHVAAATGNLSHVRLLSEGAGRQLSTQVSKINERENGGLTALHVACRDGKIPMIKGLLDLGGDLSAEDELGRTPLWYACQNGRVEIVRLLIGRRDGVKVINKADNDGNTPLHAACHSLNVDVVQLLVEYGDVDIDIKNKAQATPLLATLTRSDMVFQGAVVRVAVVLVENFAEIPSEREILEHGSILQEEHRQTLLACCTYWKKAGFLNADIPHNLLEAGAAAVQDFSTCNVKKFKRHRVCLVGQTESGKTNLVKTIVNRVPSMTHYLIRTIGIELTSWTFKADDGMVHQVTLWDFAGKDIYKPAHAPFFSEKTLFMLCIDLYAYRSKLNEAMTRYHAERVKIEKHYAEATVLCWLRLIFARQPKARVILVGTKSDLVDTREIDLVWQQVDVQIRNWKSTFDRDTDVYTKPALLFETQLIAEHLDCFVCPQKLVTSSVDTTAIEPMIAAIQDIVASSDLNSPLLLDVIDVLREVYRRRLIASKIAGAERVSQLIVPHADITSNIEALEELHNLGEVLLLKDGSNEVYDDYVILDPKLIIDFIRQIASHELVDPNDAGKDLETREALKLIRESGRVPHEFLAQLPFWRVCDKDLVVALKTLLHRFQLIYPADGVDMVSDPDVIVPLLWRHVGNVDPAPLSNAIALTKLKPPQNAPYPTHLRWEYELRQGIPPTLFMHLAVEAHVPGLNPTVCDECIDLHDEKGDVFLARISIPMDKKLGGVRGQIVRLEVIALDERVAWVKLKSFVCGMERVLEKYPGLKAGRYVEILPSEECIYRYNVDTSVASMLERMKSNGSATYDETELEWLPPLTIGIDWFVEKHWRETDDKRALQKLGEVEKKLNELKQRGDHSESYLRAVLKLSLQPERDRKFPGLWTVEKLQPEQGNPIVRIWFYSDLTGVCHQKEPIEIRVPNTLLAEFGTSIKFGMSIVSNLVPSAIDFGLLRAVADHAKKVVDARVDDAIRIHNLIAKFNFAEQTGDHRVLTPKDKSAVGAAAAAGLDQSQSIGLLEKLFQVSTMEGNPADYISSVSGLVRGSTINNHHVWASKAELETHGGVLEVYEGTPSPLLFQPEKVESTSPLLFETEKIESTIQVTVVHVPQVFCESVKFQIRITFKEYEMDPCELRLKPYVDERRRLDWRGCSIKHVVKKPGIHLRGYALEFQPYKKKLLGIRKTIAKPTTFKFPDNYQIGDTITWSVEWNNGETFEFQVQISSASSRVFPNLWTLDFQPQRHNELLFLRIHSDLTGICHHTSKPIEIAAPSNVISSYVQERYGVELKAGVSILSNMDATNLNRSVWNAVMNQAKSETYSRRDGPTPIYSLISNFVELTDNSNSSFRTVRSVGDRKNGGLDPTLTRDFMADLIAIQDPRLYEAELVKISNLAVSREYDGGLVWASPDELGGSDTVPLLPSTHFVVEVRVINVRADIRERWTERFELMLEFINGERRDRRVVSPSWDDGPTSWSNVTVRSDSMKSIDQIRKTTLVIKGLRKERSARSIFLEVSCELGKIFAANQRIGVGEAFSPSHDLTFELKICEENDASRILRIINPETSFHRATGVGHVGFARLLLDRATDIDTKGTFGEIALHRAAELGQKDIVHLLLEHGANIQATTSSGDSPLHRAALSGHIETMRTLLSYKADVHAKNKKEQTALASIFATPAISIPRLLSITQVLIHGGAEMDKVAIADLQSVRGRAAVGAMRVCITRWRGEMARENEMTTIPEEVFDQGSLGVKAYLGNLEKSTQSVFRHKICVVGPTTWGKTSLIKSLTSGQPRVEALDTRTVGIDLFPYEFWHVEDSGVMSLHEVTFWDFAGQEVYHAAHSVFFSKRSLFLVVLDLEACKRERERFTDARGAQADVVFQKFVDRNVVCWLRLIFARLPEAKVVFVATKKDTVHSNEDEEKIKDMVFCRITDWNNELAQTIRPAQEWIAVSCFNPASVVNMRERLEEILIVQESGFRMPASYSGALNEVRKRRGTAAMAVATRLDNSFVPKTQIVEHFHQAVKELDEKSVPAVMETLHELGEVIWFNDRECPYPALVTQTVLAPELVVHFMREPMSHDLINIGEERTIDTKDASHQRRRQAFEDIRSKKEFIEWKEALDTRGQVSHAMLMHLPMWNELAAVRTTKSDDPNGHVLTLKSLMQEFSLAYPSGTQIMTPTSDMILPALWKLGEESHDAIRRKTLTDIASGFPSFSGATLHHREWEYTFTCVGLPSTLFEVIVVRSFHPDLKQVVTTPSMVISVVEGESLFCIRCDGHFRSHVIRVEAVAITSTLARDVARFGCIAIEVELAEYPGLYVERASVVEGERTYVGKDAYDDDDSEEVVWFHEKPWKVADALQSYPRLGGVKTLVNSDSVVPEIDNVAPATAG